MVRAKFVCNSIEDHGDVKTIHASPVYADKSEENKEFWKWTPGGKLELNCVNPEAVKEFAPKREFYVDFTPAPIA